MEDKELLIRLSVMLEAVVKKLDNVEIKVDDINDEKLRELEKTVSILKDKADRQDKLLYGSMAIIFGQLIALIFLWIQHKG